MGVMQMSLGLRISKLRIERGWTQTQLARKVGTNTKSVKDWENDISLPSVPNVIKLCSIFHVTSDSLLGIKSKSVVVLDALSHKEQSTARAIIQVLFDHAES